MIEASLHDQCNRSEENMEVVPIRFLREYFIFEQGAELSQTTMKLLDSLPKMILIVNFTTAVDQNH